MLEMPIQKSDIRKPQSVKGETAEMSGKRRVLIRLAVLGKSSSGGIAQACCAPKQKRADDAERPDQGPLKNGRARQPEIAINRTEEAAEKCNVERREVERRKPGSALARRVLEGRASSGPTVNAACQSVLLTWFQDQMRLMHLCPTVRYELNVAGLINEDRTHAVSALWLSRVATHKSKGINHG
jgi:hypothetical protein